MLCPDSNLTVNGFWSSSSLKVLRVVGGVGVDGLSKDTEEFGTSTLGECCVYTFISGVKVDRLSEDTKECGT